MLSVNHLRHEGRILTGGAEKYALQTIQALLDVGARVHIAFSGESIYDGLIRMHGRGAFTGMLFGLIPAYRASRLAPVDALRFE